MPDLKFSDAMIFLYHGANKVHNIERCPFERLIDKEHLAFFKIENVLMKHDQEKQIVRTPTMRQYIAK